MITTTVAVECYRAHTTRDDVSLYDTMESIHQRLSTWTEIANPVEPNQRLTDKVEYREQVAELRDRLRWALDRLAVILEENCTEAQGRSAWKQLFNHSFWNAKDDSSARGQSLLRPAAQVTGDSFPNRPTGPTKPAGFA